MKASLDHVGIAVADLPSALAFYRDALGLSVELPEEVTSQQVRAHFVPVGGSTLELLEATAPTSAIARFVEKRGPGLHHITLRVDDLAAALAQLEARGVRLIDKRPRPGAEGSMVAFIHPASAHGVLVELKQQATGPGPAAAPPSWPDASTLHISRYTIGDLELTSLYDGYFRLDGGAMFGIVPRALWGRHVETDSRHRILLGMRPLLVRGEKTVLIDAGLGDKGSEKFHDIYGVDRARHLDHALAEAGVSPEAIDLVVATHLHFDHAGGFTVRRADGSIVPRFPNARYLIARGEWDAAINATDRTRASYLSENFVPLLAAGVVDFVDGNEMVMPGMQLQRTGGHTADHLIVWLASGSARACYPADLIPTAWHLPDNWVLGFDLFPADSVAAKSALIRTVLARQTLLLLEHDPLHPAGYLTEQRGARSFNFTS